MLSAVNTNRCFLKDHLLKAYSEESSSGLGQRVLNLSYTLELAGLERGLGISIFSSLPGDFSVQPRVRSTRLRYACLR